MMLQTMRILAVGMLIAAAAAAQTPINETRPVKPGVAVEIFNVSGTIDVTGWDKPSLEVTGTLGRGAERLDVTGTETRMTVKVVLPSKSSRAKSSILHIKVPADASIKAEGVSAGITVDAVKGDLDLRTVSGKIGAGGVAGRVRAETVSGGVTVEGRSADVMAKTVSGPIRLGTMTGHAEASSVSGDITVEGDGIERLDMGNVSGDLRYAGSVAPTGEISAKTHSGDVTLALPGATEAEFDLSSFSGDVACNLAVAKAEHSKLGPGTSLEFTIGSGSARVEANAFSGDVTVNKQ